MRAKAIFWELGLLVGIGCAGIGCGDDRDPADMAVRDQSVIVDFANSPFAGIHCGDMSCPGETVCCVRPVGASFAQACESVLSCMNGGAAAVCDGAEDCPNANACCASVTFERTGPSTAVPKSGTSACTAGCAASVFADQQEITFNSKLCHVNSDCVGYMGDIYGTQVPFDGCCYRPEIDLRFCAPSDKSYRDIGGYYCL